MMPLRNQSGDVWVFQKWAGLDSSPMNRILYDNQHTFQRATVNASFKCHTFVENYVQEKDMKKSAFSKYPFVEK